MAGEKTFSESEHMAILADRVATETAELSAERDQLTSRVSELESQLDVAESAKVAAEQRAEEAEKGLEEFKAQVEEEREAAARKDQRLTKVREAAGHLKDEFFEDEKRVERIVAMSDEQFEGYLEDLQATSTGAPTSEVPRETAMRGDQVNPPTNESNARLLLVGRYSREG